MSISVTSVFFVIVFATVALIPSAQAASPLKRAVLFLDSVGAQLTSTGGMPTRTKEIKNAPDREKVFAQKTVKQTNEIDETKDKAKSVVQTAAGGRPEPARYIVESGDTLSQIAENFGLSVRTVTAANDISANTTLQIGQELVILPVDGVEHTIVSGETLSHIAKRYKADVDEIITFNNIQDEKRIRPGERLIVPGAAFSGTVASLATTQKKNNYTPPPVTPAANIDTAGYFTPPVAGVITQGLHFLNAVDMGGSAYCGTPVRAAAAGTVVKIANSGWNGGYGNYIKLAHKNGTETIYAHNASNTVVSGQEIAQGETIAYMGSTGNSTGCHVHFAVRGASNPFAQ